MKILSELSYLPVLNANQANMLNGMLKFLCRTAEKTVVKWTINNRTTTNFALITLYYSTLSVNGN